MNERWSVDDVWALSPDASSTKGALKIARPASWPTRGWRAGPDGGVAAVWGECEGSGAKRYQAAVDLVGENAPASKCSCPSRKFPCKHALAVLYLWATGEVDGPDDGPAWVGEWLESRAARARGRSQKPAEQSRQATKQADRTAREREELVASGLEELELWLTDQVEAGLAEAPRRKREHWTRMGQRLVDAKASGAAGRVNALAPLTALETDWPDRMLEEFALLRLLINGYRNGRDLPERTRAAVRERIGFGLRSEEVLRTGERVRDRWRVLAKRDSTDNEAKLTTRRLWLRGEHSGRTALSLTFAAANEAPKPALRPGTVHDAEVAFYPNGYRATIAETHGGGDAGPPGGGSVTEALGHYAEVLAVDPWLDAWPVVLADVRVARDPEWALVDDTGAALPLHTAECPPWTLLAVTGGGPATVAAEWTPWGTRSLTVWGEDRTAMSL
ncbi:SWIM zinc finger family protein [Halostreptopolyspora alba]|uniref:SWIM zinc finger family protein n=1 Tax=Halostreptopolyspora alba TaxID=2487137 RepID=A0A3N0E7W2_9ACTN|nr:SWIM zinc finger family protein [Nocardiopsaceae bacterium YIM 96095]